PIPLVLLLLKAPAPTEIYPLSLHDALPILLRRLSPGDLGLAYEDVSFMVRDVRKGESLRMVAWWIPAVGASDRCVVLLHGYADADRKSTRLNSSHVAISYAVFCLKKKKKTS